MSLFGKIKQKHKDMTVERRAKWYTLYAFVGLITYVVACCMVPDIFILTWVFAVIGFIIWGVYRGILAFITPTKDRSWY